MAELLAQGAEAIILKDGEHVIKKRPSKSYRHEHIDMSLRKYRTRREAKVLKKLEEINFPSPRLQNADDKTMTITMSYIQGTPLKDVLDERPELAKEIGAKIALLHAHDIIHADLTTSNMILSDEVHFIDFGLSFFSQKLEDKAVDLHLLARALESKHPSVHTKCLRLALEAYEQNYIQAKDVLTRLGQVESRGRYKRRPKDTAGLPS